MTGKKKTKINYLNPPSICQQVQTSPRRYLGVHVVRPGGWRGCTVPALAQQYQHEDEPRLPEPAGAPEILSSCPPASLQVLRLGHLGPRYEIVPFLLAALPKIKTLGAISVLNGLKMIRDIPALKVS